MLMNNLDPEVAERPSDLDAAGLAEYVSALEGEAFPFEERAIEVHEKNLELMAAGIYNPWIDKSLGRLAVLVPGRYAKFEASSGLIASLDRYAYESPKARAAAAPPANPAAPAPEPETIEARRRLKSLRRRTRSRRCPGSMACPRAARCCSSRC
jgi:hypothetical protein